MARPDEVAIRRQILGRVVSDNIVRLRSEREWTQQKLSDESSVSLSMIKAIESGRSGGSPITHAKLAKALGVRLADITSQEMQTQKEAAELAKLEQSGLAGRVSAEERAILQSCRLPGRRMTAASYLKLLEAIRAAEPAA